MAVKSSPYPFGQLPTYVAARTLEAYRPKKRPVPMPHHKPDAVISTVEELRRLYEQPEEPAVRKCIAKLDEHCRRFIAAAPFVVIATFDGKGAADASPRGDPPGFVRVLDDTHLLLPDRPGNNRLDSLENILACPHVGLLFVIPGIRETLRINGSAALTADPALLSPLAVNGKAPKAGILVTVREAYLHCAKALIRSALWKPETWPDKSVIASPGRIWADHVQMGFDADALDAYIAAEIDKTLY